MRTPTVLRPRAMALAIVLIVASIPMGAQPAAADPCAPIVNPIACENSKPGTPSSTWDISGCRQRGHPGIRHRDERQRRARRSRSRSTPRPRRPTGSTSTGWATTAVTARAWSPRSTRSAGRPSRLPDQASDRPDRLRQLGACRRPGRSRPTAVSGIYFARLVRTDGTAGASHIPFVVRDDASHSDLVFQTSDTTWQAYNHVRRQQPLRRVAGRARLQGELQPAVRHPRHRRARTSSSTPSTRWCAGSRPTGTTSATSPASTPTAAARC